MIQFAYNNKTVKLEEVSMENALDETFWEKFPFTLKKKKRGE